MMTILPSCMDKETSRAIDNLDRTISNRHIYRDDFMRKTEMLRLRFEASEERTASRWEMADSMYMAYRHYQADSSSKYLRIMRDCASSERERCLTDLAEIQMRLTMRDIWTAYEKFSAIGSCPEDCDETLKEYLATGISVYYNLASASRSTAEKLTYSECLSSLRTQYISNFPDSMEGIRSKAQHLRDIGETGRAIAILSELYCTQTGFHTLASISYNLAAIYRGTGEKDKAMLWLARAAEYDFKTPDRNYLSLYDLAMMCHENRMLRKARKYISQNMSDIIDGNISSRIFNSSQAHMVLEEAARKERQTVSAIILSMSGIICILSIILCLMLHKSRKTNRMLQESNMNLQDSNLIKDNYVFRYMSLSVEYLGQIGNIRSRLRQTAKNEGIDAMMKQLKSPEEMYGEYD
ncbi:MAG: hypothetical protein K2H10_02015, partial [Bacteroidales bacterium]|nr:hypothetical protein [Bacteroidales bacterium]